MDLNMDCWAKAQPTSEHRMKRINSCLNTQLTEICQKVIELDALTELLRTVLPASLFERCRVASFTRGCLNLSLSLEDKAWATELGYLLPELRDKLRKEAGLYQLANINITMMEPLNITSTRANLSLSLSPFAKETLHEASKRCSFEPLKQALARLARP